MKKRIDMEKETMNKIHAMMYSSDKEMQLLGVTTFASQITSYAHFKTFRGLSLNGKPFFPFSLKNEIRKLGREFRKGYRIQENKANQRKLKLEQEYGKRDNRQNSGNATGGQGITESWPVVSV